MSWENFAVSSVVALMVWGGVSGCWAGGDNSGGSFDAASGDVTDSESSTTDDTSSAVPDTGPCESDSDCSPGVCDPVTNRCAECINGDHCPTTGVCEERRCLECTEDEHCSGDKKCGGDECVRGELEMYPAEELDFGGVPVGEEASLEVTVRNLSSVTVVVHGVRINESEDSNREFLADSETALSFSVSPGDSQTLAIRYRPIDEEDDSGTLAVEHEYGELSLELSGQAQ